MGFNMGDVEIMKNLPQEVDMSSRQIMVESIFPQSV